MEDEAGGEAQRTIVEHLTLLVAGGVDNPRVCQQGCRSTTEGGTDTVAVHAVAVVHMVGDGVAQAVCLRLLSSLVERMDLVPCSLVCLQGIALFQHRCGNRLGEDVVAESLLAPGLQGRTVGTVTRLVVFPGEVVEAFGIFPADACGGHTVGDARADDVDF